MPHDHQDQIPTPEQLQFLEQLSAIFMPYAARRRQAVIQRNGRFVHYTSAASALQIISSKCIWMRNATCMSDYSEVQHGFHTLNRFFLTSANKTAFQQALDVCAPGLANEAIRLFNEWWQDTQLNTYITSISEHDDAEDRHGRLSMWRAFGGTAARVAFVLRLPLTYASAYSLRLILSPVAYFKDQQVDAEILGVIDNIRANQPLLCTVDRQTLLTMVFAMLLTAVVSLKHEGFHEEREWRVIYAPIRMPSPLMSHSIEVIGGVPQLVYKIPFKGPPPDDLAGLDPPSILDRLIIGPSQYPWAMYQAFVAALQAAGIPEPAKRVFVSGIPIRT